MIKTCTMTALTTLAMVAYGTAEAATITQIEATADSGGANFGQHFVLSSSFFAEDQTLNSITFYRGGSGNDETLFLDIYAIGTADIVTLNFSNGTETGDLEYLGSSLDSVDYGALSNGAAMTWTFTGVTLPTDVNLFAVFSSDIGEGNFANTSLDITNDGTPNFSGSPIVDANSTPLFGGVVVNTSSDNRYSIEVTVIPEPASGALALIGLGAMAMRR